MTHHLKPRDIVALGFMTFALFVGAGNIIFPPMVGLQAGEHVWTAAIGFLITAVGLPVLTVVALAYGALLEGAVLTETVFSWPGIGRYLTTALFAGDTTSIMGGTLVIGVCFVLINNLADLLVRLTDPRIR